MFNKNLVVVFILGLLFTFVPSINAQEKTTEKKESKMMMQIEDMKCMDKIASDSTMRMEMMNMMMHKCKNDKEGMMQMCRTMMDNPEMHKMMRKMMHDEGMMDGGMMKHDMMDDSTKIMQKSENESHQHKK